MALRKLRDIFLYHLVAFLVLLAPSEQSSPVCYYPDSSIASDFNYTSCNLDSSAGFSPCCYQGEGDICLSDGLCYWPIQPDGHGNYIYRAACTDKSWTDSACAQVCTVDDPNHFETVSFCSNTTDFCCVKSVDGDCCDDANLRFNLTIPANIFAELKVGTNGTTSPNGFDPGSTPAATAGSSGSTGATTSAVVTSKSSLSSGAAAGIAIGAVLLVVAIAGGILIYWWKFHHSLRPRGNLSSYDEKQDTIESGSGDGLQVATEAFPVKEFDNGTGWESRRDSRRRSSSAISPTQSHNPSLGMNQFSPTLNSQETGNPIPEDDEPADSVHEANGQGPNSETQYLDGRQRYELGDGTSTMNSYLSASL